jgi:predicted MFS family arabinose efflux permease
VKPVRVEYRQVTPEPDRPPRLRVGEPLRAGFGAVATTVACVLPVFLLGGLAAQVGDALRFSPAGLGLAVSVYFGVNALASVPAGRLTERYGPTRAARAGIALSAAALLGIALLARSYAALVLLLALAATANSLGQLASNLTLARRVPPGRQGLAYGAKQAAIPTCTLLAGAAVPTIAVHVGWRWAFVAAAALAAAALPTVPRTPGSRPPAAQRAAGPAGGAVHGGGGPVTGPLLVVGVAATLAAGAANALGTFVVDSAVDRGAAPEAAGLTLTAGGAVCVLARVLVGWLADRRTGGHVATIAGMLLVGAAGLGLLALAGPVPLAGGVLLGFGLGWAWPGLMNFAVVQLHPQAPAAATAVTQTGVYAGGCLGPLCLGPLAAHLGYPVMWLTGSAAMLLAAALMLLGARLLARRPGQPVRSGQLVRSAMKSQSDSRARRGPPAGSGASRSRASSA